MVVGIASVAPHVKQLFTHPVTAEAELYAALAGHIEWQSVNDAARSVRVTGSELIIATHSELAARTINAYFTLKRQQAV